MVGKLITPVIAAVTSLVGGFVVLMLLFYIAGGTSAAGKFKNQAIELVTLIAAGVVDLLQALFAAVMGAA